MYSRAGSGYCLIICNATHRTGSGKKGLNGKEIMIDIRWSALEYALNYGEVIQLPVSTGNSPIAQVNPGLPGYGPVRTEQYDIDLETQPSADLYAIGGVYKYKTTADIEPEVQIGDKIYFKPRTLNNPANLVSVLKNEKKENEKFIYKVPYENIFCAVRGEQVIPIGTWTIVEPIFEDWDEILVPTYYDYKDAHGNKIERPKKEWIQKKVSPSHDNMRGIVKYVGSPYKGDVCDIMNGDRIVFRPKACHFETIENEKLIVMRQDQILAKLEEDIKLS